MGLFRIDGIERLNDCLFEVSDKIAPDVDRAVDAGLLSDLQEKHAPSPQEIDLSIALKDKQGRIIAGLLGKSLWGWMHIKYFWVDASVRGQGVGSRMVKQVEEEGIKRGCHTVCVYTHTFQAPDFYRKLGYKEFVVMDDFPIGHQRIGFMKRLAA